MLAACSSNNSLVSSFSQRKYTKGYFADGIGTAPSVKSNSVLLNKQKPVAVNNPINEVSNPVVLRSKQPTGISIVVKQKTHYVSNTLAYQPQARLRSVASPEKVTDDGYGLPKGKDLRAMSILVIAIGLILITLAILALLPYVPPFVVLVTGLITLFFGAIDLIRALAQIDIDSSADKKSTEDEQNKRGSTMSLVGFILEIGGLLLFLALFFAAPLLFGTSVAGLTALVMLLTICRISFYAGFICCIVSLIRGFAVIGIIIGVALLIYILLYPIFL